jgi:hypothetical protein
MTRKATLIEKGKLSEQADIKKEDKEILKEGDKKGDKEAVMVAGKGGSSCCIIF